MNRDLTELNKLEEYLKENGFNYKRVDEDHIVETLYGERNIDRHQLIVLDDKGECLWDAISHFGSYGEDKGLIEVMGYALIGHDDVEGWLTADDVIAKIEGRD